MGLLGPVVSKWHSIITQKQISVLEVAYAKRTAILAHGV